MSNGIYVGVTIIKRWEQCRLNAYIPIPGDPPTIGWGATGSNIHMGDVWTQDQADADLTNRVNLIASQLRKIIYVPLTDNQFGALLSLAYNVGTGALPGSKLITKLNAGDMQGAAEEFLDWNKSRGKIIPGLTNRRKDEHDTFLT